MRRWEEATGTDLGPYAERAREFVALRGKPEQTYLGVQAGGTQAELVPLLARQCSGPANARPCACGRSPRRCVACPSFSLPLVCVPGSKLGAA